MANLNGEAPQTSSDSEFSDATTVIATNVGLTRDSEDSRPAAPSPPATPSQNTSQSEDTRSRSTPRRIRTVRISPELDNNTSEEYQIATVCSVEPRNSTVDDISIDRRQHVGVRRVRPRNSLFRSNSVERLRTEMSYVEVHPLLRPDHEDEPDVQIDEQANPGVPEEHEPSQGAQSNPTASASDRIESGLSSSLRPSAPPQDALLLGSKNTSVLSHATKPATKEQDVPETANSPILSQVGDGSLCPICMEMVTNSGKHRVVCLKCGHLFGHSCVEHWLKVGCNNGNRRCPTCNKRACLNDIRILYLTKVVPLDTVERDRLLKEKEEAAAQKRWMEHQLATCRLHSELRLKKLRQRVKDLEKKYEQCLMDLKLINEGKSPARLPGSKVERELKLELVHSTEIRMAGGCRVMAYNCRSEELVVSQQCGNTLFPSYGVRVLDSLLFKPDRLVSLHQKMIRDLAFNPLDRNLLLSVSLDRTAKLVGLNSSGIVHTFEEDEPLWSCCWEKSNPHRLLIGSQLGKIRQYDRRMLNQGLKEWQLTSNSTPIVALASVPCKEDSPFPQGGFLSCRLNAVYAHSLHGNNYECDQLGLHGPFISMRYVHGSQTLLTSSRPSKRCSYVKVNLNTLALSVPERKLCTPEIYTFDCGVSARVLSRLASLSVPEDPLVVAHHESGQTVNLWSMKTGNLVHSMPIHEPVIDMMQIPNDSKCLLSTLSETTVNLYKLTLSD